MTTRPTIPLPVPTTVSSPYWEACRRGELTFQRCPDCSGITFIPQPACSSCLSTSMEWEQSAGRGKVYSYTVVWRPQTPAFDIPYVVAIIDLNEGYRMLSNIVDCDPSEVAVGMPVEVTFREMSDEITLPYFRPSLR